MPEKRLSPFERAFAYTHENEGDYSNHKSDRGGATRFGITRKTASLWRGRDVTDEEMKSFPLSEAKEIYEKLYWKTNNLDCVDHPATACAIFDIGVVCGTRSAARLAQRACNERGKELRVDGVLGRNSLAAINSLSHGEFIRAFADLAAARFRGIVERNPRQRVFERGWLRRADRLLSLIEGEEGKQD